MEDSDLPAKKDKMNTNKYALLVVLLAVSVLASGCGLQTGGIPNPCWATGHCSNSYTAANGWNNCPAGWEAVFQAGESPYGYTGFASYSPTLPGGDAILGPDGQPEVVVPNPSDPKSLNPIAYCIAPGYQPPWAYIPVNGSCQKPAASYLQGTWNACPDQNQSHDCVCVPPGVIKYVPTPTGISFVSVYSVLQYYCADKAKLLGGVQLSVPSGFSMTVTSGPNDATTLLPNADAANDNYYSYIGPEGASFTLKQCQIPPGGNAYTQQTNPALCSVSVETYGTCALQGAKGVGGGGGGGGSCQPPSGGCSAGTHWQGSLCECEGTQ